MMILHYLHQIHPAIRKIHCLQLVNQYQLVNLPKFYTKLYEYCIKIYVHKIIYRKRYKKIRALLATRGKSVVSCLQKD